MTEKTAFSVLNKVVPEKLRKKAEDRLNTCISCDKYNAHTKRCSMCGCFMEFKVFLPDAKCPLKKW